MKRFVAFFLGIVLMLVCCAPMASAAETEQNEEVAAMQALLGEQGSWYNMALTSDYGTPADIDLYYFFYSGFADESQTPTDAETAFLNDNLPYYWIHRDLFRLPADKMDAVLVEYFGVDLGDVNGVGMDKWTYWEETDCYYNILGGPRYVDITVKDVVHQEDGTLQVYYRRPYFQVDVVVTLLPRDDGYQILSNLPVVDMNTYWLNYDWENFSWRDIDGWDSDEMTLRSLMNWLRTDAPMHYAFVVESHSDGGYGEMTGTLICEKFEATPLTFIRELAKEDLELRLKIVNRTVSYSHYDSNENVPYLIAWLDENDLETQEEKAILQLMRDNVVKYWGDEIPKTGDPVVFVAGGLVLSGMGGVALLKKKKEI